MANLLKTCLFLVVLLAAMPLEAQQSSDPAVAGKQWNRYTVDHFVILSLDPQQGEFLRQNLPKIKQWSIARWGLPDYPYPVECRIQVVSTPEQMQKLFQLTETHVEIQTGGDGREQMRVIWLLLEGKPAECLPSALVRFALQDIEREHHVKFGFWVYRGMAVLNSTIPQIRSSLVLLANKFSKDEKLFFGKTIFSASREQYNRCDTATRTLFDVESAAACLMLRKEFGQKNFHKIAVAGGSEENVRDILGFQNYASFDVTFKRYMWNLSRDVLANKTPDHYLEIVPAYQPMEMRR